VAHESQSAVPGGNRCRTRERGRCGTRPCREGSRPSPEQSSRHAPASRRAPGSFEALPASRRRRRAKQTSSAAWMANWRVCSTKRCSRMSLRILSGCASERSSRMQVSIWASFLAISSGSVKTWSARAFGSGEGWGANRSTRCGPSLRRRCGRSGRSRRRAARRGGPGERDRPAPSSRRRLRPSALAASPAIPPESEPASRGWRAARLNKERPHPRH